MCNRIISIVTKKQYYTSYMCDVFNIISVVSFPSEVSHFVMKVWLTSLSRTHVVPPRRGRPQTLFPCTSAEIVSAVQAAGRNETCINGMTLISTRRLLNMKYILPQVNNIPSNARCFTYSADVPVTKL